MTIPAKVKVSSASKKTIAPYLLSAGHYWHAQQIFRHDIMKMNFLMWQR
ncbi:MULTISPECIES: hypothetical protein [Providencia]|uniref:Uncharacterized protein n=1 Tax=Providencia stuartii ATCC 25827 TaxID=471874 RepID=A0AA86Z2Q6_PROST|nr:MULTISPECIES: hypothetical protein [Providencia]EDU61239.1 hypothetical protein PROSTU_00723 [Providencia stuartii ATCC 25827]MDF4175810.1 hypothetical protein [Providencia thailandensis]MBG5898284.1 hypothetical protein [Providencia stuartii]MBG5906085.1 hypothetical protein [Providencia stuartii]MBG5909906.1 hypothetical protein [Providencia stuartii]